MVEAPAACKCCGSDRIVKMGEDITGTLEVVPRQWKVIRNVREKFTCRDCEKISQPPFAIVPEPMAHDGSSFHPAPRGWAGPSLLAFATGLGHMATQWLTVFEKFGQHQPLNRQAERYAREGVDLSLSTLADQVGAVSGLLKPLHALIGDHVLAAGRLHGPSRQICLANRLPGNGRHDSPVARPRWHEDGPALDLCPR